MQDVIRQLESIRRRTWLELFVQRGSVLVAWTLMVLLVVIGLDYLLRLPQGLRIAMLLAGAGVLGWFMWTWLRPVLAYHPSLTQLALRVEGVLPAVAGRLASSVEFAAAGVDDRSGLARRSVAETQARLQGAALRRVLRHDRTWRGVGGMLALIAASAALALVYPAGAETGLKRTLLPWSDARWPARTGVASLMDQVLPASRVHPRGAALVLRAKVTRGDDEQRVHVRYRLQRDGSFGAWQELVLTHQRDGIHERLIDTDAEGLEVQFLTADDRTEVEEAVLVPPPAITRASLRAVAPPYAAGRMAPIELELGPGTDDRAAPDAPILVGSEVRLALHLNKPLPVPQRQDQRDAWLRETFGWESGDVPLLEESSSGDVWMLRWRLEGRRDLPVALVDEHGLSNTDPIQYRIPAQEDRPPSVTILQPQTDEPVLASAVVRLEAEASDDVALESIALEARVQRGAEQASASAASIDMPAGDSAWQEQRDVDAGTARIDAELALGPLELVEGDIVIVHGAARDRFELEGQRHDRQHSPPRRLRVIGELEFSTQLRRQLGAVRQSAIRIEAVQGELQEDVADHGIQPGLARAQAQIAERIAAQAQSLEQIERQIDENRLEDPQLADLITQSRDLLDFAGRAASSAVEAIEQRSGAPDAARPPDEGGRAGSARGEEPPQDEQREQAQDEQDEEDEPLPFELDLREPREVDRPVVDAQQEVREELADLIELLDRDEDTWVVTRQLEELLDRQERLLAETAQLNERTMGRDREDLTPEERSELDRIREAQEELREQAGQTIEGMRDRAEAMEEVDPESAAGMRNAARTAEQGELERDMQEAAERARQNQLQNAVASQESARRTMQRMLEAIEESKRAQPEQLLRRLASLIESIERLVNVQENELDALAAAQGADDATGRDRAMIRLAQNTQAVAAEARAAGPQARRIARALDRAADAQGAAITALRADPTVWAEAERAEQHSLDLLKEAAALAEELQQQTQEEQTRQRREELIEAYRALAERQVAIRAETLELGAGEQELTRRRLVDARRLAANQDELRNDLADLRTANSELLEAAVFSMVHRRVDEWARGASDALREGRAGVEVTDPQEWIGRSIGRLVEALEEALVPPEQFAGDEESGGGTGGGGQPNDALIPPASELRLLQGMQREIYDRTRGLDERGDLDEAARRQRLRDLGQTQRELMDLGEQMMEKLKGGGEPEEDAGGA